MRETMGWDGPYWSAASCSVMLRRAITSTIVTAVPNTSGSRTTAAVDGQLPAFGGGWTGRGGRAGVSPHVE